MSSNDTPDPTTELRALMADPTDPRHPTADPAVDPAETTTIPAATTQALPAATPFRVQPASPVPDDAVAEGARLPHLPPPGSQPDPSWPAPVLPQAAPQPAPRPPPGPRHGPQGSAAGVDHARSAVDARGGLRPRGQPHRRGPQRPDGRTDDDRRPRRHAAPRRARGRRGGPAAPLSPGARPTAYLPGPSPYDGRCP